MQLQEEYNCCVLTREKSSHLPSQDNAITLYLYLSTQAVLFPFSSVFLLGHTTNQLPVFIVPIIHRNTSCFFLQLSNSVVFAAFSLMSLYCHLMSQSPTLSLSSF